MRQNDVPMEHSIIGKLLSKAVFWLSRRHIFLEKRENDGFKPKQPGFRPSRSQFRLQPESVSEQNLMFVKPAR